MPELTIRLKKNADGTTSLTCTRTDGSVTWQIPKGGHAQFFALHDLTHYAVETVLLQRQGFYGLVADGWNLTDFGAPWVRGPLPPAAGWVELIVGFLDAERAAGLVWNAADCNEKAELYYSEHGGKPERTVTDDELAAIRDRRRELFSRWASVAPGGALELEFSRS